MFDTRNFVTTHWNLKRRRKAARGFDLLGWYEFGVYNSVEALNKGIEEAEKDTQFDLQVEKVTITRVCESWKVGQTDTEDKVGRVEGSET